MAVLTDTGAAALGNVVDKTTKPPCKGKGQVALPLTGRLVAGGGVFAPRALPWAYMRRPYRANDSRFRGNDE